MSWGKNVFFSGYVQIVQHFIFLHILFDSTDVRQIYTGYFLNHLRLVLVKLPFNFYSLKGQTFHAFTHKHKTYDLLSFNPGTIL